MEIYNSKSYGQCPNVACGYMCWLDVGKEPNLLEIKDRAFVETDYGTGEEWTEVWKCPKCQTVWHERDGYP